MSSTELVITESGRTTMEAMRENVRRVGIVYGDKSKEYREILESFANAIGNVMRLGGTISRDGSLSLYGASFIQYGVIFSGRDKIRCPECWHSFSFGVPVNCDPLPSCQRCNGTGETVATVDDAMSGVAMPGTWSVHS